MLSATCQIKCNLIHQARLPAFKGIVFRDGFSRHFKSAACLYNSGRCDGCRAARLCDYANCLEMPRRIRPCQGQKTASPPRPFLIEPPTTTEALLPAGAAFDFQLLLFGYAINAAPVFVRALEMMGKAGIGPDRAPFEINTILCGREPVYHSEASPDRVVPGPVRLRTEEIRVPETDDRSDREMILKIVFLTPLKFKGRFRSSPDVSFQSLVRMMLRRIFLLFDYYDGGLSGADPERLVEEAAAVRTVASDLIRYDWLKNGSGRDKAMLQNSIVGSATFHGRLGPYLPLVRLCRQLHIGRQTEFGLGKFTFEVLTYG